MPNNIPLNYRDAHLEMEERLNVPEHADLLPSAMQEAINVHAKRFRKQGANLVHEETGETIEEWCNTVRDHHPHYFPSVGDDILFKAFAQGNMTARAQISRDEGHGRYLELCKAWGADPSKPSVVGKRPGGEKPPENAAELKARADNPWLEARWNITAQARLVKSLGIDRARSLARAAGCDIGSTKPNPAFN
jgi:hypothetical protein